MPFNHDAIELLYKKYVITPDTAITIPDNETVVNVVLSSSDAVVVITVKATDKV
jgi:hypothetical protein